jgi:hypothetical protein
MSLRNKDQIKKPVLLLVPFAIFSFTAGYSMVTPPYSEKLVEVAGAAVASIFGVSMCWLLGVHLGRD